MSRVLEVDPGRADQVGAAAAAAARAIRAGDLVVFPTETVYGLAARPDDPDATGRIYAAKGRSTSLNLPVLVGSTARAWEVVQPDRRARVLARAFWPGPLTMVLPRSARSRPWQVGAHEGTLGVRVPDHRLTAAVLAEAGPVATTSANLSGQPPIEDADRLVDAFGDRVALFLVLPRGVTSPGGPPSTVLDLSAAPGPPAVLRMGSIDGEALRRAGVPTTEEPGGSR